MVGVESRVGAVDQNDEVGSAVAMEPVTSWSDHECVVAGFGNTWLNANPNLQMRRSVVISLERPTLSSSVGGSFVGSVPLASACSLFSPQPARILSAIRLGSEHLFANQPAATPKGPTRSILHISGFFHELARGEKFYIWNFC